MKPAFVFVLAAGLGFPAFRVSAEVRKPAFYDTATAPGKGNFNTTWRGFRAHWESRRAAFAKSAPADAGSVVFIGDSITEICPLGKLFPDTRCANRGISGDTSRGMLFRLKEDVLDLHPCGVVLLCGTNDMMLPGASPEGTADNVKAIVTAIHASAPAARIAVLRIMPTAKTDAKTVAAFNAATDRAVAGLPFCLRVDTYAPFLKPDGAFDASCFRDGVHPGPKGYALYAQALRPALASLRATAP